MPQGQEWRDVHNEPLIHVLNKFGLATNLKLCLDAGDPTSAPSGATSWLDRSGNGHDFFRGTTSGSDATDPTFNGTSGALSNREYWGFDGGDYFTYDSTNEIWMENLHKDNAVFTALGWVYIPALGVAHSLIGTAGVASAGNIGVIIQMTSANIFQLSVKIPGSVAANLDSIVTFAVGWNFFAVSLDESVGAGGATLQVGAIQEAFSSTYTTPSASSALFTMELGARGGGSTPLPNLSRMGVISMHEGGKLTDGQLMSIYNATRGRYGV